ncbi:hypothetical protein NUH88_04690 [Nisaea acidiphila]|uniref:Uncharacterized protein n=1 Tax=Nisaea acidiphila TaxID=1862145 RepID=A0A9J7AUI6_9PROT|nr:hypothetical protein [Nisaea acidiphila]UUX50991.1 hypothetical protein NUH88_04690 [Nisaea acidiphila]
MIREWLTYLTTPCPAPYRRMGFLRECVGIESRYRRNRSNWAPHLERSRKLILGAAERCESRDTVLIFGAGLLYDVPLSGLLGRFDKVILADLLFMGPARRAARENPRLELVTLDVTASLAALAEGRTEVGSPPAYLDDPTISLVVSANVLSQLPIVPNEYLEERFGQSDAAAEELGRKLIRAHLDYLAAFSCPVALITDEARIVRDSTGSETATVSALHDVALPDGGESWNWEICPLGEIDRHHSVTHRVKGYEAFPKR